MVGSSEGLANGITFHHHLCLTTKIIPSQYPVLMVIVKRSSVLLALDLDQLSMVLRCRGASVRRLETEPRVDGLAPGPDGSAPGYIPLRFPSKA